MLEAAAALFARLFPVLERLRSLTATCRGAAAEALWRVGGSGALGARRPLPGLQLCLQPIHAEEEGCCWWLESTGWIIFARVKSKNLGVGM